MNIQSTRWFSKFNGVLVVFCKIADVCSRTSESGGVTGIFRTLKISPPGDTETSDSWSNSRNPTGGVIFGHKEIDLKPFDDAIKGSLGAG